MCTSVSDSAWFRYPHNSRTKLSCPTVSWPSTVTLQSVLQKSQIPVCSYVHNVESCSCWLWFCHIFISLYYRPYFFKFCLCCWWMGECPPSMCYKVLLEDSELWLPVVCLNALTNTKKEKRNFWISSFLVISKIFLLFLKACEHVSMWAHVSPM